MVLLIFNCTRSSSEQTLICRPPAEGGILRYTETDCRAFGLAEDPAAAAIVDEAKKILAGCNDKWKHLVKKESLDHHAPEGAVEVFLPEPERIDIPAFGYQRTVSKIFIPFKKYEGKIMVCYADPAYQPTNCLLADAESGSKLKNLVQSLD
ncbi:MAG: hypothetical protein ACTSXZ_08380 [Alphaproteobacteria bacterium]